MNQAQILQLIDASQTTLKHELQVKHPESKYHLLMLHRSLQILKNYIEVVAQNEQQQLDILQNYFHFSVNDLEQSTEQLCSEMRKQLDIQALEALEQLNQLDLNFTKAGS